MKVNYLLRVFSLCLMALTLSACSLLSPVALPTINNYSLNQSATQKVAAKTNHKTVLVAIPTASPGFQSTQMIYLLKPYQLQAFSKNAWIAPPAQMLQPLIVQSLRNAGVFHAVIAAPTVVSTDVRLVAHLLQLQQNFIAGPSRIEIAIQVDLINKNNDAIASRRFTQIVVCKQDNPQAGVIAANQATQLILQQVVRFVAQKTSSPSTRGKHGVK